MNTEMREYELDLSKWKREFEPEEIAKFHFGHTIGFVQGLLGLEDLRSRVFGPADRSVPCDIFLFAKGEPARRDVTKVGGVPYRPRDVPWPLNSDGQPKSFLAQYRFVESRDLVGHLPGDLLLVFTNGAYLGEDPSFFHFEWYPIGISNLIPPSQVPEPAWTFVTCYGVRHRTVDFHLVSPEEAQSRLEQLVGPAPPGYYTPFTKAFVLQGMKIGGRPYISDYDDPNNDLLTQSRFICSLAHIVPLNGVRYPWLNQAEPLPLFIGTGPGQTLNWDSNEHTLVWYEGFTVDFFCEQDGRVWWYYQL